MLVRSGQICASLQAPPAWPNQREYTGRVLNGVGRGGRLGIAGVWYLWATMARWMRRHLDVLKCKGLWRWSDSCLGESEVYHLLHASIYSIVGFFDTLHPISTAVVQQKHQVDLLRLPDSQARSEQSDPFWPPRSGVDDDLEPPSKKFKPSYLEGQEE